MLRIDPHRCSQFAARSSLSLIPSRRRANRERRAAHVAMAFRQLLVWVAAVAMSTTVGAQDRPASPQDSILTEILQLPVPLKDIPLKVFTYTLRDAASDKLRIVVAVDIDRSINPDGRLALAFKVQDDKGQPIASEVEREVTTPLAPRTKIQTYTQSFVAAANTALTLKVAVVDDQDKRGSIEQTFNPRLTSVGQISASDLLIADKPRGTADVPNPVGGGEITSGMLHAYLELYGDATDALKSAGVIFQIAQSEDGSPIDGAAGRTVSGSAQSPTRRPVEGSVPLGLLSPGDYVVRAVVNVDGRKVGQITKTLKVGRATAPTSAAAPVSLRSVVPKPGGAPITVVSRIERFDRSSVLKPEVVGFFLDRLNLGARNESNASIALEHARSSRFDEAAKALSAGTGTVPGAFLGGLALYSKGDLEPAAAKFREALRLDSEFFPAAFYLGSCYAAGGRDTEAVGAWQLSLITESDAPFIFTLLGDALLRLREVDHALEILNEALAVWPDDEEVHIRLGAAFAMAGKRSEALREFEPYLEKHPDDHERHLMALRTLNEARALGKPIRSKEEDRALFAKWAAAYRAAKGPQQALVDQWQKAMSR
jgi:tetratricopeptide (TPR) repeat protein